MLVDQIVASPGLGVADLDLHAAAVVDKWRGERERRDRHWQIGVETNLDRHRTEEKKSAALGDRSCRRGCAVAVVGLDAGPIKVTCEPVPSMTNPLSDWPVCSQS